MERLHQARPKGPIVAAETLDILLQGRQDRLKDRLAIGDDVEEKSNAFQAWIRDYESRYGKFVSAEPINALTSPGHPGEIETIFRLKFLNGGSYVSFYWQDGKLASRNCALRSYPAAIWAVGVGPNRIVLHDCESGVTSDVHFDSKKKRKELADKSAVWTYLRDSSTSSPRKAN